MKVRVATALRIRPCTAHERSLPIATRKAADDQTVVLSGDARQLIVRFDEVYDEDDSQFYFYEQSVRDLVDCAFEGSYCTLLSYGPGKSGKTYTLLGSTEGDNVAEGTGVFLRVFQDLFDYQQKVAKRRHVMLFVSALELCGEEMLDLLAKRGNIGISNASADQVFGSLHQMEIPSMEEAVKVFNVVRKSRQAACEQAGTRNLRSHVLLLVDIVQVARKHFPEAPTRDKLIEVCGFSVEPSVKGILHSRVLMVDLAGSNAGQLSGAGGESSGEDRKVTKALQTLGTCVRSLFLSDAHTPFGDSKLTELLKPTLTENTSRTLFVAHVSPLARDAEDTWEVLRSCDRIKELRMDKSGSDAHLRGGGTSDQSLLLHKQLTADVRIAVTVSYYAPQRPRFMSFLKGISVEEARDSSIGAMKREMDGLQARKEDEYIRKAKEKIEKDRVRTARTFASRMNRMIEEYEEVSQKVKEEKKNIKRLVRDYEASSEEAITEAKKAKKNRLKAQEKVEEMREQLGVPKAADSAPSQQSAQSETRDDDKIFRAPQREDLTPEEKDREALLDNLVNNFQTSAKELNDVYATYVKRLSATQRQRTQVRRIKMHCSGIILESTLVEDIIDFIIDRAVDISHKVIKPSSRYSWKDIEGLSTVLRNGDRLYPPLVINVSEKEQVEPTDVFHQCTFLSSDESDEENSHYPQETRRPPELDAALYDFFMHRNTAAKGGKDTVGATSSKGKVSGKRKVESSAGANDEGSQHRSGNVVDGDDNDDDEMDEKDMLGAVAASTRVTSENGSNDEQLNPSVSNNDEGGQLTDAEKQRLRARRDQQYLMRVYDSPTLVDDLLKFLRGGTVMLKHGRVGKPHRRLFWVSLEKGKKNLLWVDPDTSASRSSSFVDLDDVSYIQIGCFSKVFKRHNVTCTDPSFYRSFTIGMKNDGRTVDIVADTTADFEAWVLGLSNLVRVDPSWGGKLDVSVEVNYENLNCFEISLCESNYIFPTQYLMLKRRVTQIATHTLEVLQNCGNDAEKAHEILDGIHPPGINEKGAVYLTKGELRFACRNEIDIIRITKIWMLFQQMNLVYDDNFVPATTFGITRRN